MKHWFAPLSSWRFSSELTQVSLLTHSPTKNPSPKLDRIDQVALLAEISDRWRRYSSAAIDDTIFPGDDMFGGNLEHYHYVGVSALHAVTEAMLASRRSSFRTVLDVPCGGGRVTRHLAQFFPEAQITVSDVDKGKQAFAASQFNAQPLDIPADFSTPPAGQSELIFVGSLLTHFDEPLFTRALGWFADALAKDGVLILTLHGRTAARRNSSSENAKLRNAMDRSFMRAAFGFAHSRRESGTYGVRYGTSLTPPSWIMSIVQARSDVAVVSYKEAGWGHNQDVLVLQKWTY